MEKLIKNVEKELKVIEETGINTGNLENAYKLASIAKNLLKVEEKMGGEKMREDYGRYYDGRGGYRDGGYSTYNTYDDGSYGRRGVPGSGRGRYRGDDRMSEHLDRIMDGADMYKYGRDRYRDGGDKERMHDGLEKLMYGICMFVESTMDFAETPEEKEIIRKHIQKIKNI